MIKIMAFFVLRLKKKKQEKIPFIICPLLFNQEKEMTIL